MARIYLDHAATTPISPEVREAMEPWLGESFGNPSSAHRLGVEASEAVDRARRQLARALGAREARVLFTSGGTEANNLGVLGQARARAREGRHILVGATEHPSVRAACAALVEEGFELEEFTLAPGGEIDLEGLSARLRPDTVLVAQMLVSNELGSIYPLAEVARRVRERSPRAALHVDAVQALGKLELSLEALGADSLAVSAHKLSGPKGVGALVIGKERPLRPLCFGGGQEGGLRPGTENVAGVVGFGRAAELAEDLRQEHWQHLCLLRTRLLAGLSMCGAVRVLQPGRIQSPAILSLLLEGPPAEVWLHHLDARGIAASAGSACQARKRELSPGYAAIGLGPEEARRVLRLSFGRGTTLEEVEQASAALRAVARELEAVRR